MTLEQAEVVGLQALTFLANDHKALEGFIRTTGLDPQDLPAQATRADLLVGVLDFLLQDDTRIQAFCSAFAVDLAHPGQARGVLAHDDRIMSAS